MKWNWSDDGIMKWKKGAERGLQEFGSKLGKGVANLLRDKRTPQQKFEAAQRAWYEGGRGPIPKRSDFK